MRLSTLGCAEEIGEMLLGILFTSLSRIVSELAENRRCQGDVSYLGRLADLLANNLPLVVFVLLDSI